MHLLLHVFDTFVEHISHSPIPNFLWCQYATSKARNGGGGETVLQS